MYSLSREGSVSIFFVPFSFESKKVRDSKVCAACPEFSKQPLHAGRAAIKYPPNPGPLLNPTHTCEYAPRLPMFVQILQHILFYRRSRFSLSAVLGKMFGRNGKESEHRTAFAFCHAIACPSFFSAVPDSYMAMTVQQDEAFLLYCPWCTAQTHIGITYRFSHLIISAFPVSVRSMRSFIFHSYCLYGLEDWDGVFIRKWVRERK